MLEVTREAGEALASRDAVVETGEATINNSAGTVAATKQPRRRATRPDHAMETSGKARWLQRHETGVAFVPCRTHIRSRHSDALVNTGAVDMACAAHKAATFSIGTRRVFMCPVPKFALEAGQNRLTSCRCCGR